MDGTRLDDLRAAVPLGSPGRPTYRVGDLKLLGRVTMCPLVTLRDCEERPGLLLATSDRGR
jgi:hypothetical protein